MDKCLELICLKEIWKLNMTKVMEYYPKCFFAKFDKVDVTNIDHRMYNFDGKSIKLPDRLFLDKIELIVKGINRTGTKHFDLYNYLSLDEFDKEMECSLSFLQLLDKKKIYSIQKKQDYCYEIDFIFKFTEDIYKEYDELLFYKEQQEQKKKKIVVPSIGEQNEIIEYEDYCYEKHRSRHKLGDFGYFDYLLDFMREKYNRADLLLVDQHNISISDVYIPSNFKKRFYIHNRDSYCGSIRYVNSRPYNNYDFNVDCHIGMNIIFIKLIK